MSAPIRSAAVRLLDRVEARNAVHVDDDRGLDDAGLQQRDEALAAGEHPRVVAAREQRERLVERLRSVVVERRGLHAAARTSSRGSGVVRAREVLDRREDQILVAGVREVVDHRLARAEREPARLADLVGDVQRLARRPLWLTAEPPLTQVQT